MKSHLAANAEVAVRDELRLVVAVALLLQEHVQHADGDAGQGDHEGQDLPRLGCETDNDQDQFESDHSEEKRLFGTQG